MVDQPAVDEFVILGEVAGDSVVGVLEAERVFAVFIDDAF